MEELKLALGSGFWRCHKKYIVQRDRITNIDRTAHYIQIDDTTLPIGQTNSSL